VTTATKIDLDAVRRTEFPWTERATYLDAASFGPLPLRAQHALAAFNRRKHEAFSLSHEEIPALLDRARTVLARLVNADPAEIALGANTTHGLHLAADLLTRPRDRGGWDTAGRRVVLFSDREFPANVYPWLALERFGFRCERVASDERGHPDEAALLERVASGAVAALAVSAVQFAGGYRADLAALGRACRAQGTLFVVDAIQALGAVPLDVRASAIDILAAGGQKWLCGPFGSGFAWVRRDLITGLEPSFPGWTAFSASSDFSSLLDYRWDLVGDARRFELGTPGFADIAGLTAAVEVILSVGVEEIWARILEVQQPLLDWAASEPRVTVLSELAESRRSGILSIATPEPQRVHALLRAEHVSCVVREGALRLAPHFYNTPAEGARVASLMQNAVASCVGSAR
jgi:cysteine desulfurase / selenocysteine lyase